MKTLLIAAVLLSLVTSICSQTAEQQECIHRGSTSQKLELAADCANTTSEVCIMYVTCDLMCCNKHHNYFTHFYLLRSCQISATVGLASPASQAFTLVVALMD